MWQLAIELVKEIYLITGKGALKNDFALRDQFRRAAISIPTNIAEGFERRSRKEYLLFLNISKGSAGELRSLLRVGVEIEYLHSSDYELLRTKTTELARTWQIKCGRWAEFTTSEGFPYPPSPFPLFPFPPLPLGF